MRRQREDGYCLAFSKADGSAYTLPRSEYTAVHAAWMRGEAFWTGGGFYGGAITLRLGDIVAVTDIPPDVVRAQRADKHAEAEEDRADDLLTGAP